MSLSRDSKQERIWKAYRRAEFGLQQRIERINWEEDVLFPEIARMKANEAVLPELTPGKLLEFEIVKDENPDSGTSGDASR
jgi:hypothetical protein